MVDKEKVKGKAEQLMGKVEQAVGKATGSEETQARGTIHEAEGKAREKMAEVKGKVKKEVDDAREMIAGMKGLNLTSVAVGVVGAVIVIAIFCALVRGRRQTA